VRHQGVLEVGDGSSYRITTDRLGEIAQMTMLAAIADWSVFAFASLLLAAQMLAHEVGYRLGYRRKERGGEVQAEGVGVVVGVVLGLLTFVQALTLSFANTRFTERVEGTLAEANAIGTAWLRAEAIGHVRGPEIAKLLEEYTQLRRAYVREGQDQAVINELNRGHVAAIVREQPDPVSASLMRHSTTHLIRRRRSALPITYGCHRRFSGCCSA
jgi:hypothetical protein